MTHKQRLLDRILTWVAYTVVARPGRVILITLVPSLLCSLYVAFVPINLSFFGLLPKQEPAIARYLEINERLHLGSQVLLLVEGDDNVLDDTMQAVLDDIATLPEVKWVSRNQEKQWLEKNAPYLVKPKMFRDWLRLATHPEDTASAARLAKHIEEEQEKAQNVRLPGKQLVLIELKADARTTCSRPPILTSRKRKSKSDGMKTFRTTTWRCKETFKGSQISEQMEKVEKLEHEVCMPSQATEVRARKRTIRR